jgi:hypothetical protein
MTFAKAGQPVIGERGMKQINSRAEALQVTGWKG